ncbi:MAG: NAD(P)H-hydrate dehydratase [Candidatus Omnitrophica bacterium]|nr:NAD(P)H-hydrate dehydratase [Candidatus Omnitrophota bacterium]
MNFRHKRQKDTHKGDYGHLFILGGSPGLTGAVCLAGNAAMRSGCGLATIGIPASLNAIIEIKMTEAMSLPLPETASGRFSANAAGPALEFINGKADAVLIGPGISTLEETAEFVKKIVEHAEKPLIIDADAITIVSGAKLLLKKRRGAVILTPHPGEMSRLTGLAVKEIQKRREKTAREFADKHDVIVILKGYRTVITDGKNTCMNLTGNPGMATAGSGDVLAGIAGSFLAQGYGAFESAKYAAYIHGLAGDIAAKETGETPLIASDIIEKLPSAFNYSGRKTG